MYSEEEKHKIVFCVGLVMVLGAAVFVQTGPFFPLMAKAKGVDQSYIGYIFGTMATMQIVSGALVAKVMARFQF